MAGLGTSLTIERADGSEEPAEAFIFTGTREVPAAYEIMPWGFSSVTNMFGQKVPCIAHRFGDRYGELTLQGATESLAAGFRAMELSLARTSDGVWFGLHDEYLDRVALGVDTKTLLPSAMTWDQVRQYSVLAPKGSGTQAQPFMRLEDYLPTANYVVTFVDTKYVPWTYWPDVLAIMGQNGGPARWVAKFFGPTAQSQGWTKLARSQGYKAWGYGYAADAPTVDTWADYVDFIGMEYGAQQSAWDACLATGKRVIGHITPTQAAAAQAVARGATALMVSGTGVVSVDSAGGWVA